MDTVDNIITFWIDDVGPKGWYSVDDALDQQIRDRFGALWKEALEGGCGLWLTDSRGALAYLILTDQFPRNMFRGDGRSFATDPSARAVAKAAIEKAWDLEITEPARQFFYMPFMHAETLAEQNFGIEMIAARLPENGASTLQHAKVHRDIIQKFNRFPFRNDALGRETTAAEQAFIDAGGYGAAFRDFTA